MHGRSRKFLPVLPATLLLVTLQYYIIRVLTNTLLLILMILQYNNIDCLNVNSDPLTILHC